MTRSGKPAPKFDQGVAASGAAGAALTRFIHEPLQLYDNVAKYKDKINSPKK
jgi:hypothetical protein